MRIAAIFLVALLFSACSTSTQAQPTKTLPDMRPRLGATNSFEQGVTPMYDPDIFVVKENEQFRLFSSKNPNNGCRLSTDLADHGENLQQETFFFDPCHGDEFDSNGNFLQGKSDHLKPMIIYPHVVENGQLIQGVAELQPLTNEKSA